MRTRADTVFMPHTVERPRAEGASTERSLWPAMIIAAGVVLTILWIVLLIWSLVSVVLAMF